MQPQSTRRITGMVEDSRIVEDSRVPIAVLEIGRKIRDQNVVGHSFEPIYGGYANARGEVSLFAARCTYRVNFKAQTLRQRPSLNPGAQANYDAVEPGEPFVYSNVEFLRLSHERITEICASGTFRITM